jgi:hypothetical protein
MQSAKKTTKILSALSMAAAAVLASKAAHGATLSLYYGNDPSYSNSNNQIEIGTGYAPTGTGATNVGGANQYFTGETTVAITGLTQTITLPVGDYLSLAIDAVLTGNSNPDGGKSTGTGTKATTHQTQPAQLGLSSMSAYVFSNDANGSILTPLGLPGAVSTAANGGTTYFSTAVLNNAGGGNNPTKQGANINGTGSYNVIPNWVSQTSPGDVEPNQPGYDQGTHASGNVYINSAPFGGITPGTSGGTAASASNTTTGINELEQFATSNNVASYSNATDFLDSLIYQGLTKGVVTLTGAANTGATAYWSLATAGSSTAISQYKSVAFGGNDVATALPLLVIDVVQPGTVSTLQTSHAIVSLADTATDNTNYATPVAGTFSPATAPTLTIHGGQGGYTVAQVTAINAGAGDVDGNVPVTTWNPTTDAEIYGVDVKVGGQQATAGQLAALLNAINGGDGTTASTGVTAGTTDPSRGQVLAALDTGTTTYNLFLDFPGGGPSATDDLGLDFSGTNDANLVGYSFTAISVVPEPMSLSLLALGGVSLMARRNRRKA